MDVCANKSKGGDSVGRKGEKAESIKIAKKLLKMGMKREEIISVTGLTKEEIEKIKQKYILL